MGHLIVEPSDSGPVGPAGKCIYCLEPIGSPHKPDCVATWETADPCPFCGGVSSYTEVDVPPLVACDDCGALGPDLPEPWPDDYRERHDAAVRLWNLRHSPVV